MDKFTDLTPIEKRGDHYFKRDDLFKIDNSDVNGGKLRQCISIVQNNEDLIREKYCSTIITPTSVKSPQGVIVAKVAKLFNLHPIIGVGNIKSIESTIKYNKPLKICSDLGAEIIDLGTQAFNSVLNYHVRKLQEFRPMFNIGFGLQGTSKEIIEPIAFQVQNIPEEITTVVIPSGSGYSAAGIIEGLVKYEKKHVTRVVVIQPFGYDRRRNIRRNVSYYPFEYSYKYLKGSYPYNTQLSYRIDEELELDTVYESKSFDYMIKNNVVDTNKEKVLFWIVANANWIR